MSELPASCYGFAALGATGDLDGLRVLLHEQPDLLIMDLCMKPLNGLDMLEQIRREGCSIPAVILTMSDPEAELTNAIRAGVRGYLLKNRAPEDVVDAIRRVAADELVVAPTMTIKMIDMLRGDQRGQEPKSSFKLLTERECECEIVVGGSIRNAVIP